MKISKLILPLAFFAFSFTYSQEIQEPEFIGETIAIVDGKEVPLEKKTIQTKTNANASAYIFGIGKIKTKLTVDGCCSNTKLKSSSKIEFVTKAVDNNTDPKSIVAIFPFSEVTKKSRKLELSSLSTFFGGSSSNNAKYIDFTAKKFGTSSYKITVQNLPQGEYGITVSNPNALDQKAIIVSTFSIE
ncbi:hypothetical protein [Elizabethkingia ursingii]